MPFDPDLLWGLIPITALMIPIVAIWSSHQREVLKLKLQEGVTGDARVLDELRELKQQILDVRETTTRYDMSFDSALQRIESRVGNLESRVSAVEQQNGAVRS